MERFAVRGPSECNKLVLYAFSDAELREITAMNLYFSSEDPEDAGFYSFAVFVDGGPFWKGDCELLKEVVVMPLGPLRAP